MKVPFRRKAVTATPGAIAAMQSGDWNPYPLLGGGAVQRIQNQFTRAQSANYGWMYRNSPAVRTVIDVITRNVGQMELRLYEEVREAERQPRPDHPAALSLRYPNDATPAGRFIREVFKDFLIYDNAYVLIQQATADGQLSLARIPAYMVEVLGPSLFEASTYRVWPQGAWTGTSTWGGAGTPLDFDATQILHWHGEHPLDPRIGISRLDTLREVIAEDAALQQATVELAQAGLQEPMWVYRPDTAPEWSNDARKGFEEDLTNRIRRRNRTPPVMEEGMELRSFGVSPQDAQMLEVRRWAVQRVASEYGVPLALIGLGTGRAENLVDAQAQFYTDTLLPYCLDFTQTLNQRILVGIFDSQTLTFEFSFDEKLMGNDRLRALTSATGRAIMLTNEARAKLNLPPVDGGDELVTPLNVVVGDNPKPSPQTMPPQQPGEVPQDGSGRQQDQLPNGQPPPEQPPKALIEPEVKQMERIQRLHPRKATEMARQHQNVDLFQTIVERHLNRVTRGLSQKAAVDWRRWDKEFTADLGTALERVIKTEGDLYTFRLGGGPLDMAQTVNYRKAMAEQSAIAINETIRSDVGQYGLKGTCARIPQHVASAGTSLGVRATTWAREEAARQAPLHERRTKTWISDTGRHAEFDGQTVPIDADWPAGFAPGGTPGCGCSMSIS